MSAPSDRPQLGWGAALAALLWAAGLLLFDAFHIAMTGDVDTSGFLVAILALAPAWAFIGRNVSISFLGQSVSVQLSNQDGTNASGGAAAPATTPPATPPTTTPPATTPPATTPPATTPPATTPPGAESMKSVLLAGAGAARSIADALETSAPDSAQRLREHATTLQAEAQRPPPKPVVVDPVATGNPAIDLRNRIVVRLNALAQTYQVPIAPGMSAPTVLASLRARSVLTDAEATGLGKFVALGDQVAQGAKPGKDQLAVVANSQVRILANLDAKLAADA